MRDHVWINTCWINMCHGHTGVGPKATAVWRPPGKGKEARAMRETSLEVVGLRGWNIQEALGR